MQLLPFAQIDPHLTSGYLILGYGVMWLIGFAYVMLLVLQQKNMERDIELMKQILDESDLDGSHDQI